MRRWLILLPILALPLLGAGGNSCSETGLQGNLPATEKPAPAKPKPAAPKGVGPVQDGAGDYDSCDPPHAVGRDNKGRIMHCTLQNGEYRWGY